MKPTSFIPQKGIWARQFPQNISQHDIVYKSPPEDAMQGLPIGNGDMGMLLWTEGSRLIASINKVDLFDDLPEQENGMSVGVEYDRESTLRHAARLVVDFGMPIFDILFLDDFNARLGLADASAVIESKTPFLKVKTSAYASHSEQVIVMNFETNCNEAITVRTVLERYGSRPYRYWHLNMNRNGQIGLDGTQTSIEKNTLLIQQQLRTLHFVVGARVVGMKTKAERQSGYSGCFQTVKSTRIRFTLFITVLTSENSTDPRTEVMDILDAAEKKRSYVIYQDHARNWERFWRKSFLSIPNKYIENIWYLNLYYANSSCQGAYPPRFNNAVWSWNRDVSNWVYYFHWNTQSLIWPLHTANHGELAIPYYRYRAKSLKNAKIYARNQQKHDGAFYADVADRLGRSIDIHCYNQTPGAQIALLFWKHYKYTGDQQFLKENAWPVIRETTRYYASLVVKDEAGVYHSPCSQAYEGSPLFADVITDTAMILALMPTAVECAIQMGTTDDETALWREIGENMSDFHIQPLNPDEIKTVNDGKHVFLYGIGKGKETLSGHAFSVGKYLMLEEEKQKEFDWDSQPEFKTKPLKGVKKGDYLRNRYGNPKRRSYYGTADPELATVFPSNVVGLNNRESDLFRTAVDQVRLHPSAVPGKPSCMGWCPYPIVLARLGLANEAAQELKSFIMTWQVYCQGFGQYADIFVEDNRNRWKTYNVTDDRTGESFPASAWPFRHFTPEAVSIACTTLNEMLLQSHEGFIRLLPAIPQNWDGSFQLAAENGFLVHIQFSGGRVEWVEFDSLRGNPCCIVHPWESGSVFIAAIDENEQITECIPYQIVIQKPDVLIKFNTAAGERYLISKESDILSHWVVKPEKFTSNMNIKTMETAQLGLPRMY